MKWGIRRTPEQLGYKVRRQAHDLTAKTIPAGTKCFRIATKDDPGVSHGKDTYIAYLPVDRANIRSITPWLMSVRGKTVEDAYEREYEITKDIKVASYEEVAAIRRELMAKPEYRAEAATNLAANRLRNGGMDMDAIKMVQRVADGKSTVEAEASKFYTSLLKECQDAATKDSTYQSYVDELKTDKQYYINTYANNLKDSTDMYTTNVARYNEVMSKIGDRSVKSVTDAERRLANMAMDAVYGANGINKQTLQTELKKRGYNAMYDNAMISVNSANSQEAYEPLILFDGGGTLKETGGKFLTREEVRTAENDYSKWREGVEKDARKKRIQA